MIGSLRVRSTPEASHGFGISSPSPTKKGAREGCIPFISVADGEGDEWPKPVAMTKEAQHFIEHIEGPICVLACMGQEGTDKVKRRVCARALCVSQNARA
jgi:hypothetical protein